MPFANCDLAYCCACTQVSAGVKLLSYATCGAGNYNKDTSTGVFSCEPCAAGYYNSADEAFSCVTCPEGVCVCVCAISC
jgi:hypothetical protein